MITYYSRMPEFTFADFSFSDHWEPDLLGPKDDDKAIYIIDQTTGRRYLNRSVQAIREDACLLTSVTLIPCAVISGIYAAVRLTRLVSCYHLWPCVNKQIEGFYYKTRIQVLTATKLDEKIVIDFKQPIVEDPAAEESKQDLDFPLPTIAWPEQEKKVTIHHAKIPNSLFARVDAIGRDAVLMVATPVTWFAMTSISCFTCLHPSNNQRKLYKTFEALQFDQYIVAERIIDKRAPSMRIVQPPLSMTMI